jgi:CDP-glycerol glycerophosphotransferase (TagB/SpsB family)
MEAKRELPVKDLKLVGIPYMDDMAARLDSVGAAEPHERTVLLAPSWGDSALFGVYGGKIIEKLLETGYHVIVRPHPQSFKSEKELMDKLMEKFPNSDKLEWNRDSDNFEVLRRSDILVSDFSGVTFDFSLIYDKPVIYTTPNFDLGPYDAWWMEEPLWTTTILPHIGAELTEDKMDSLKELIDTCIEDPRYAEGRKKAKEETWANAGAGAKAVADYLQEKLATLTEKKEG